MRAGSGVLAVVTVLGAVIGLAPAAAVVPLDCADGDLRTTSQTLPRPGVVVVDDFSSGTVYYTPFTITEDGGLDVIVLSSHDGVSPLVAVWENGTDCYGDEWTRNPWGLAPNGRVYSGDGFSGPPAGHYGDASALALNRPMVGMSPTSTGLGYWLVAGDGGIFAFGDARFWGSTGSMRLNEPIVGMSVTPTGNGYWLVASDGGIFTFGDASFFGSTGGLELNSPITGMTATPTGNGYWMVAGDGGIFAFGDAAFCGSTGGSEWSAPIAGMIPNGNGYTLIGEDYELYPFPCEWDTN